MEKHFSVIEIGIRPFEFIFEFKLLIRARSPFEDRARVCLHSNAQMARAFAKAFAIVCNHLRFEIKFSEFGFDH